MEIKELKELGYIYENEFLYIKDIQHNRIYKIFIELNTETMKREFYFIDYKSGFTVFEIKFDELKSLIKYIKKYENYFLNEE